MWDLWFVFFWFVLQVAITKAKVDFSGVVCLPPSVIAGNGLDGGGAGENDDEPVLVSLSAAPSPQSEAVANELQELSLQPELTLSLHHGRNPNLPPLSERKNGEWYSALMSHVVCAHHRSAVVVSWYVFWWHCCFLLLLTMFSLYGELIIWSWQNWFTLFDGKGCRYWLWKFQRAPVINALDYCFRWLPETLPCALWWLKVVQSWNHRSKEVLAPLQTIAICRGFFATLVCTYQGWVTFSLQTSERFCQAC